MTPEDVKQMKVAELKKELDARNLPSKGLKAVLVKRLISALEEPEAPAAAAAAVEEAAAAAAPAAAEDSAAAAPEEADPAPAAQPATTLPTPQTTQAPTQPDTKGKKKKKKKKKKKRYNEPVKLGESRDAPASQTVDDPKNNVSIE